MAQTIEIKGRNLTDAPRGMVPDLRLTRCKLNGGAGAQIGVGDNYVQLDPDQRRDFENVYRELFDVWLNGRPVSEGGSCPHPEFVAILGKNYEECIQCGMPRPAEVVPRPAEVGASDHYWIAFYADWSAFVVFNNELDCLRHAVDNAMSVKRVAFGEDPK